MSLIVSVLVINPDIVSLRSVFLVTGQGVTWKLETWKMFSEASQLNPWLAARESSTKREALAEAAASKKT
eukprot:CAMPEP_0204917030 /NCGR_PEP_ID=MMETSP1397-20131031/14720_1 /ASSEMBLY_ACC=CAM_ASM_000891 /TAXON_ID=49980 /ORGANISM="Climacostomum Climacostomum virens, Strain Stock W-24" /LENGTH=69 /DNA_ID=CAMNT_0052089757 /DNA_START=250 /DNA_END=456 /DNA_ORIENTATION=-